MWKSKLLVLSTLLVVLVGWSPRSEASGGGGLSEPEGIRAAEHVGSWRDDSIRWRSKLELEPHHKDDTEFTPFTHPLPADHRILEVSPGDIALVRDAEGRTRGIRLPGDQSAPWMVTLVVRQPAGGEPPLRPPLVGQQVPQRVTLRGAKFSPNDRSALVTYPGFVATPDFGEQNRDRLEASFDDPDPEADRPVFAQPAELDGPTLAGTVTPDDEHRRRTMWILAGLLVLFVALSAAMYRWLGPRAKEEEADAIMEAYDDELAI